MAQKTSLPFDTQKFFPFMLIGIVVLAFAVGMLWQKVQVLEKGSTNSANQPIVGATQPPIPDGKLSDVQIKEIPEVTNADHVRGDKNADIYLIEYSDFECPFCKRFHETAKQTLEEYDGKVAWVYRHFPLDSLHPKARKEAEASECVFKLGGEDAFWKFADIIYDVTLSNNQLDLTKIPTYANQAGVDGQKVQDCLDSGEMKDKVDNQYKGGVQAGVSGTPGNFVVIKGGSAWAVPGAVPFETLKVTIDDALSEL